MMELFSAKLAWSDPILGTRLLCTWYIFVAPVAGNIIIILYTLDTVHFQDDYVSHKSSPNIAWLCLLA